MAQSEIEQAMQEPSASVVWRRSDETDRRFANLRGVQWRVNLGILPSSSPSSIDDFRRGTADSRRRYAALRRRLLIDPHVSKDGSNSPDLAIDNPLSQNPDSTWGRFFRNSELEKTVDQDLSRLYPEHGSYFQALGCQGMLRRILLLWCLRHPEYGYRQGMHELLAPLLYVLHVDVEYLSEVRKIYEDHFTDRFDDLSFEESDVTYNFDFKKFLDSMDDEIGSQGSSKKVKSLNELDPEIQTIVMLSDAYGPEGELGVVLSEKYMEHDAYCMFDALMNGSHGLVSMADFFAHSPTGLPPVIEASRAIYHILSVVDSSLYSHLVELGVEPQYFALRWLRVLFGREFSLQDLLIVWDEIFSADNSKNVDENDEADINCSFKILSSPRGALISGMAVSMILYLRSSLLATENATSCLQRLLNFPESIDLSKIIEKAKSLQALALDVNACTSVSINGVYSPSNPVPKRSNSLPSGSVSPKSPLIIVPDSYWEEKWRVLHKAEEEQRQSSIEEQSPTRTRKGWPRVKLRLFRAETDPSPNKNQKGKKEVKSSSVRRSLLEDLSRQLGDDSKEMKENDNRIDVDCSEVLNKEYQIHSLETEEDKNVGIDKEFHSGGEESSIINGNAGSEENSSLFSDPASPLRDSNYNENDSESSSVGSNLALDNNCDSQRTSVDSPLPVSFPLSNESPEPQFNDVDATEKSVAGFKERKLLSGKFQWFWKFGHNSEETSDKKGGVLGYTKSNNVESSKSNMTCSSGSDSPHVSSSCSQGDTDQNVMGTLRSLGQSMLEHIQVIESVFQQEKGQPGLVENLSKNGLVEKGQVTAMTALKELRKISNFFTEM